METDSIGHIHMCLGIQGHAPPHGMDLTVSQYSLEDQDTDEDKDFYLADARQ